MAGDKGGSRAQCSICQHPDRAAIDQALANSRSKTKIAEQFGVSYDALKRHAIKHAEPAISAAVQANKAALVASLTERLKRMDEIVDGVLVRTLNPQPETVVLENGDTLTQTPPINERVVLAAIREARGNAELVARYLGGEPPDEQDAEHARRVLADPDLARRAAELEELAAGLAAGGDSE